MITNEILACPYPCNTSLNFACYSTLLLNCVMRCVFFTLQNLLREPFPYITSGKIIVIRLCC